MIEKNQEYRVKIEDMTHEGAGVAKIDGFTLFIQGALIGEIADIKITKVLKNFAYGKIIKINMMSPKRRAATCENYKKCGGCNLQHMSYDATLDFKKKVVQNNLKKFAKINIEVLPTIGLTDPYYYRNKAQYPIGIKENETIAGFFAERTHEIVQVTDCNIQSKSANKILKDIMQIIKKIKISAYNEKTREGILRHIIVRTSENTGDAMLIVVTNTQNFDKKYEFINGIIEKNPEIKSIYQNVNMKNTNVILGEKNILLYGNEKIIDYIGKFKFEISPNSFFQVNSKQTETLYKKALEYAELTSNETVFDLYCGIGTISLFLAQKAKKVYGVEIVKEAIQDAKKNAQINNISNTEFVCGKSEEEALKLYNKGIKADVIVIDPPRSGCEASLIDTINEMKPQKIVYVSCNSATLARDIALFEGYNLEKVQPVDMFPWTHHVECVILMSNMQK